MMDKNKKKEYNLSLAPLWPTTSGNYKSLLVDDEIFDKIQKVEKGGMLFIRKLKEESRRDKRTSPYAYVEYLNPQQVAAYNRWVSEQRHKQDTTDDL